MGGVGDELPLLLPGFLDGAKGPAGEEDVDGEEDGQRTGSGQREGGREGIPIARRTRNRRMSRTCRLSCFASCRRVRNPTGVCSIGCLGNRLRCAFYGAFIDGDDGLLGECGGRLPSCERRYTATEWRGTFAPSQDHAACFFGCRRGFSRLRGG